jgi:hypothetical protein
MDEVAPVVETTVGEENEVEGWRDDAIGPN